MSDALDARMPCRAMSPGAQEIGFSIPERYNASAILFDNLGAGRGERCAVTGPAGRRTYAELAADAARFGAGLQSLGLQRGRSRAAVPRRHARLSGRPVRGDPRRASCRC